MTLPPGPWRYVPVEYTDSWFNPPRVLAADGTLVCIIPLDSEGNEDVVGPLLVKMGNNFQELATVLKSALECSESRIDTGKSGVCDACEIRMAAVIANLEKFHEQ